MNKKKITILALHLGYGGIERFISSLCSMLIDKYDIDIISTYKVTEKPVYNFDNRINIKYLIDDKPNKEDFKLALKSKNIISIFREGFKAISLLNKKKKYNIEAIKNIKSDYIITTRDFHNELVGKYANKDIIKIATEHNYPDNDQRYINRLIKSVENEAKETANKKAKEIIGYAIQKCAADHTSETTVSVVTLPNDDMKGRIPDITFTTDLIVGFPGETDEQFEYLYDFVKKMKFEKMGVFEYSREKNTASYGMDMQVNSKIKHARYKKLMALQQDISLEINKNYVGKVLNCIVECFTDDNVVVLRSEHDAPEIDGLVYAKMERDVVPGDIEKVLIEKADEYDLYGRIV